MNNGKLSPEDFAQQQDAARPQDENPSEDNPGLSSYIMADGLAETVVEGAAAVKDAVVDAASSVAETAGEVAGAMGEAAGAAAEAVASFIGGIFD
ncbi:MAG: hypothetical protein LBV79_00985 [Candidatus Adiutrix sp.]|jgi:hypothetical protein|nr:hypothetical protein [Candidatus Adiutrix sp.]